MGKTEVAARIEIGETRDVAQHAHRVFVDRVDVEQVVLHAPDDAAERGQIAREHAVVVHARECVDRGRTLAQQTCERGVDLVVIGEVLADRDQCLVDPAHEVCAQAADLGMLDPDAEKVDQRGRAAQEQVGRIAVEATADIDEIEAQALRERVRVRVERLFAARDELLAAGARSRSPRGRTPA